MPEAPKRPAYSPAYRGSRPYYGSGYAGVGFRGIGGDLLKTFPRITPIPESSGTDISSSPEIHGSQLIAPMRAGPDGYRVAPCPVCLAHAIVPQLASGWAPLRCDSCGTEFVASDGSPPPAPGAKPKTYPMAPSSAGESRLLAMILAGDGDERLARCPVCSSLEVVPGMANRVDMRCHTCGTEYTATTTPPARVSAPPPPSEPSPHRPPGAPITVEDVRTAADGKAFVLCPWCRKFKVDVPWPKGDTKKESSVKVTCPGCRAVIRVAMSGIRAARLLAKEGAKPPLPPPPPPTRPRSLGRGVFWLPMLLLLFPLLIFAFVTLAKLVWSQLFRPEW